MAERRIEQHLYERYQTATGKWSRSYFVRLTDWQGIRRVWPAGTSLSHKSGIKRLLMDIQVLSFVLAIVVGVICFGLVKHTAIYIEKHRRITRGGGNLRNAASHGAGADYSYPLHGLEFGVGVWS